MDTAKNKLYNYEKTPPKEVWEKIAHKLDEGDSHVKSIQVSGRQRTKRLALITAIAAAVVLILVNFVFINKGEHRDSSTNTTAISTDSIDNNHELLESIIQAPENKKLIVSQSASANHEGKYFTVIGPNGSPVKISPKVATLIISADGDFPPKPVWDKRIDDWQRIMLTNASANPVDLMDIVQKASSIQ